MSTIAPRPRSILELRDAFRVIRARLEPFFCDDTAASGSSRTCPSAGHCAVVAVIIHHLYGGDLVSSVVSETSHWFNRILVGEQAVDVDLTGDQFGFPSLLTAQPGALYPPSRVRAYSEVNDETLTRARLLAARADLCSVADGLGRTLSARDRDARQASMLASIGDKDAESEHSAPLHPGVSEESYAAR